MKMSQNQNWGARSRYKLSKNRFPGVLKLLLILQNFLQISFNITENTGDISLKMEDEKIDTAENEGNVNRVIIIALIRFNDIN